METTINHKFSESEKAAIMKALDDPEKRRKIIEILEAAGALIPADREVVRQC